MKERESFSRVNGLDAVTIDITRDAQSNLIALSEETLAIIASLNEELSDLNVELEVQMNMADTMEKNIDLIIELAITGGVLAIFVLWIFLRNFRLVTAIALAIPISVYTAFNFFYAGDISVNSLSLLGMALAIGMLLDNSVVVMENIYRLAAQKMHPDKAVVQGTKEVWKSIVAATLTTITVFLPFIFSEELNQISHDAVKIGGKISTQESRIKYIKSELTNVESSIKRYYELEEKIENNNKLNDKISDLTTEISKLQMEGIEVDKKYKQVLSTLSFTPYSNCVC